MRNASLDEVRGSTYSIPMLSLANFLFACQPESDTTTGPTDTAVIDTTAPWVVGDGPLAEVSGHVFTFGPAPAERSLVGAAVSVVEDPTYTTTANEDGDFVLEVPSGAPLTFRVTQEGFASVDSAAIFIDEEGVEQLGFQVPAEGLVEPLAIAAGIELDPERCQIATTVSSADSPPYGKAGVGEPDAIAALDPSTADVVGPVYFAYLSEALILPDPEISATTIDGGVLWGGMLPGEYVISAEKEGVPFTDVLVRCRAGALVNASPPHGIEYAGE